MALNDEIELRRREIRTDGYAMSIGEWISLYEKGELDILNRPGFELTPRSWTNFKGIYGEICIGIQG